MPRPHLTFVAACSLTSSLVALAIAGCGAGHEEMTCGPNGCSVCDGYGCRPADPGVGSTGGATGGSDASACDPSTMTCPCSDGQSCSGGTQCVEGLCLVPCAYSSQCGSGRVCVNGKCVVGCDAQTPCEAGYVCSVKGVCEPDATDPECSESKPCVGGLVCSGGSCVGMCTTNTDCAPGELCDGASGTCITDPQPKAPCEKDPSVCTVAQTCVEGYCRYACGSGADCVLIDARIPVCDDGICKSEAEANPECITQSDCDAGQDCVSNRCM